VNTICRAILSPSSARSVTQDRTVFRSPAHPRCAGAALRYQPRPRSTRIAATIASSLPPCLARVRRSCAVVVAWVERERNPPDWTRSDGFRCALPILRSHIPNYPALIQPQLRDEARVCVELATLDAQDEIRQDSVGATGEADLLALAYHETVHEIDLGAA